jgi:hypothetical protein
LTSRESSDSSLVRLRSDRAYGGIADAVAQDASLRPAARSRHRALPRRLRQQHRALRERRRRAVRPRASRS